MKGRRGLTRAPGNVPPDCFDDGLALSRLQGVNGQPK